MLNKIVKIKNVKAGRRIGRGIGSKKGGHTATRGTKGQKSRSGYTIPRPGFEGGQMPLSRRIPKLKGFRRAFFKDKYASRTISIGVLETLVSRKKLDAAKLGKKELLKELGLTSSHEYLRIRVVNDKARGEKKLAKDTKDLIKKLTEFGVTLSKSVTALN